MLRKLVRTYISNRNCIIYRTFSQASQEQTQTKEKWDLLAGVLVERLPVISKSLSPLEQQFKDLLSQIEFENSLKSDHELKHERDLVQAELIKKGDIEIDLDDSSSKQTAQDLKDAYTEEFKKFKLAPRTTEDDKTNNIKSTNRKLEDTLYLLVEQKVDDKNILLLPQGKWQGEESLKETAERILKEIVGERIDVFFYGNAPCGFHKFKYPKDKRIDSVGAKVFFFRSALKNGNVDEKLTKKYEWLDKDSLVEKLKGSYSESVKKFLL